MYEYSELFYSVLFTVFICLENGLKVWFIGKDVRKAARQLEFEKFSNLNQIFEGSVKKGYYRSLKISTSECLKRIKQFRKILKQFFSFIHFLFNQKSINHFENIFS